MELETDKRGKEESLCVFRQGNWRCGPWNHNPSTSSLDRIDSTFLQPCCCIARISSSSSFPMFLVCASELICQVCDISGVVCSSSSVGACLIIVVVVVPSLPFRLKQRKSIEKTGENRGKDCNLCVCLCVCVSPYY